MKKIWLLIGSAVLALSLSGCGSDNPVKEAGASTKDSKQEEKNKEYQDLVLGFEKQILQVENSIKEDVANYDAVAEKFANKQASIQDTYTAANKAKKAYEIAKRKAYELDVPKQLPQEVVTSLEESKSKLSASYYSKENRMGHIMDFLDSNKSSAIEKANEQNTLARSFTMQSVTKLMEAKEQVGLKIDTQQK